MTAGGERHSWDVVVVGGGTAGSAAAAACATAGLSVLLLERGPLDRAGARWVNGVPEWAYDAAGLAAPTFPERRSGPGTSHGAFHLVAGWDGPRVVVDDPPMLEIDMRHLVSRLQARARRFGAELRGHVVVEGYEEREAGVLVALRGGDTVRADTLVLAGGLRGPGAPDVGRHDLCTAAQHVHEVTDLQAARAFFAERDARPGDALCFSGIAGGYSIVNVRLDEDDPDGPSLAVLTGSIPGLDHAAGAVLHQRFLDRAPWAGRRRFGGARAIPLRRPLARLGDGRIARIGDAAAQVFAVHGSGIGAQLVAAKLLADTLVAGGGPGDYRAAWHRRWGGLFAASNVFARFTRDLTPDQVGRLVDAGLMTSGIIGGGLDQRSLDPDPRELPGLALGAVRAPRGLARLAPTLARMQAVRAHALLHPDDPDRVYAWARRMGRLAGDGRID